MSNSHTNRRGGFSSYYIAGILGLVLACLVIALVFAMQDNRGFVERYAEYMAYINNKVKPDSDRIEADIKPLLSPITHVISGYEVYSEYYTEDKKLFGENSEVMVRAKRELTECMNMLEIAKLNLKILENEKLLNIHSIVLEAHSNNLMQMYKGLESAASRESRTKDLPPKPEPGRDMMKKRIAKLRAGITEAESGLKKLGF